MGYGHRAAQCPNAKIITLHNREVVSKDEDDDDGDLNDMPPLEDASDVEGDELAPYTLATRRALYRPSALIA